MDRMLLKQIKLVSERQLWQMMFIDGLHVNKE